LIEVALSAPLFFDESIGYWTGEPDRDALERALEAVVPNPSVERTVTPEGVLLRGPEAPVLEEAARLRKAGLL
jgi:hypothetical protein